MSDFSAIFRRHAGPSGRMTFAAFMRLALYDPAAGYYAAGRPRVGRSPGTDFFTASDSLIFGELVAAACVALLGHRPPADHTFVEIGAEPGGGVLHGVRHPFREAVVLRLGNHLELPPRCVVFSNELFDAQPFHRLVFRAGVWRELGVEAAEDEKCGLREILLPELSAEVQAVRSCLPAAAPEGYQLDLPLAAAGLCGRLAAQPWTGLFIAFDYGKSWEELTTACPAGTARAYFRHAQGNDLLARPGEQDLTCHLCWDWLGEQLARHGFATSVLESQEAFFIRQAAGALAALIAAEAGRFSPRKQSLLQLLHPSHMGRKFQVLRALRD
jgi:SAM-dependent MidA family methyltransferase